MIRRHRTTHAIAWLAALTAASPTLAQRVISYTESAGGANSIVYGLPVPTPIDSLTPVDGFRSYAALEARLQALALASDDLSAHDIGRSANGRVQWAYVASSENALDVDGRPKAAFFINATTHAREWGAPEVAAGTLERLVAGADDGGVVRYLLDNTRVIVVPVHNVDGFLQTQRYPTQAVLGTRNVIVTPHLGGPSVWTFGDILKFILRETNRERFLIPVPFPIARMIGSLAQIPAAIGLKPALTKDQVLLLEGDNIVSPGAEGLAELGVEPTGLEAIAPSYLYRYRVGGQYAEGPAAA